MTPTERAAKLAEIDRQLYGEMPGRDSLWSGWSGDARFLRNELIASDSRSKEMVGLLREAESKLSAHAVSVVWAIHNIPNGCKCAICDAYSSDTRTSPSHTPGCTITRLRAAADMAEGTGL